MEILFGLAVLVLLFLGLRHRKKQDKKWLREERHEESGAWIDKRAGERGTYGSLDAERERERQVLSRSSGAADLVWTIQTYCFEHYPGFYTLSDEQVKKFMVFCKKQASAFVETIGAMPDIQLRAAAAIADPEARRAELKKIILDFTYERFPRLLELELDVIKKLDLLAGHLAKDLLDRADELKENKRDVF